MIKAANPEKGPVYYNMPIVSYCEMLNSGTLRSREYGAFMTQAALVGSKTEARQRMNQDDNYYYVYYYEDINGIGYIPYEEHTYTHQYDHEGNGYETCP